jgi:hypothetical protein
MGNRNRDPQDCMATRLRQAAMSHEIPQCFSAATPEVSEFFSPIRDGRFLSSRGAGLGRERAHRPSVKALGYYQRNGKRSCVGGGAAPLSRFPQGSGYRRMLIGPGAAPSEPLISTKTFRRVESDLTQESNESRIGMQWPKVARRADAMDGAGVLGHSALEPVNRFIVFA